MKVQEFADLLHSVRSNGSGFKARCPGHDDREASLSIHEGDDERILLKCFAGCEAPDIVDALGLTMADLYPERPESSNGHRPRQPRRIVATYPYYDETGELLYEAVRYEPKDFKQRRPDGVGGWAWNLQGVRRVLYRLPELLAASSGRWVLVTEGEKDVDRLLSLGFVATTCPQGAGKWRDEYSEALRGRYVAIIPDNDDPGRRHAEQVARSLYGVVTEVRIVTLPGLPDKGDVSDWLDNGGTPEQLKRIIVAAPGWTPDVEPEPATEEPAKPAGPVLRVVSLAEVQAKPVDWLWDRWLARGKVTIIGGHAGDGKSTVTVWLSSTLSNAGTWPDGTRAPKGRTLFLLAEDGLEDTLRPRLDQHGADVSQVFAIQAVQEPKGNDTAFSIARHLDLLEERIIEDRIDLLVIDPITSFMPKSDRNAEGDVRDLLTPLTALADRTGVAVTPVMHVGKPSGTNRRPIQQLLGATAFGAIARTVWMVAPTSNEPDETRRVLAVVKSNLATKPPALEWSRDLDQAIKWHGESDHDITELLGGAAPARPRDNAEGFLRELLADGPMPAKDIEAQAKQQGISTTGALRRAREAIGAKRGKSNIPNGPWLWYLPGDESKLCTWKGTAQVREGESKSKLSTPIDTQVLKFDGSDDANDPTSQIPSPDVKLSSGDEGAQVRTSKLSSSENKGVLKFDGSVGTNKHDAWNPSEHPDKCRECTFTLKGAQELAAGYCDYCQKRGRAS
ncbi:AAA family ATPase [Nitrolancea hollandica]|uniref:AAA+ ATPase domain-containing protein n=1 Tax=Nitrolancea hollandica Lb TaxID=1129897 RepID=I4EHH3_9BACT|nr:AAA family ATPase [Nitrolancea hollandica]CCF84135.1 conserved hypothetical protein [Nitrolancea hollandica Lb]